MTGKFARLTDMLIQKVFRPIDMIELDTSGTVMDRIIDSYDTLIDIRLLRNELDHEYKSETIHVIFEKVLHLTPLLLKNVDSTVRYASSLFNHAVHERIKNF